MSACEQLHYVFCSQWLKGKLEVEHQMTELRRANYESTLFSQKLQTNS